MKINLRVVVVVLAALYCVSAGTYKATHFSRDLIPVYGGVRCLVHGCNPYDPAELQRQYLLGHGDPHLALGSEFWTSYIPVYPPSAFLVLSPMALFTFPEVRLLWALVSSGLFVMAAAAVLLVCPPRYRWVSTVLVSLFLVVKVNTSLLAQGNPTPFAIALLVLATILFLRDRYIPLAAVMLMLSLAVKPQMGGLIAVYLLARRIHWRPVVMAMAGAVAILLVAGLILSVHPLSHDWVPALRANVAQSIQPGQTNDPRPEDFGAMGIVNLQTLTSIFLTSAKAFNVAAFVIFAALLAAWAVAIVKANASPGDYYLQISALAVLSLLPVYHRSGDDLLLLLTIPAIMHLLEKRRALGGWIALTTALICIAEFTDALRVYIVNNEFGWPGILQHKLLFILLMRQQSVLLLLLSGLYLAALFKVRAASQVPVNALRHSYSA